MTLRPWHRIRRNHQTRLPQNLVFLDTETYETYNGDNAREHTWRLAVACTARIRNGIISKGTMQRFDNPADLWLWVCGQTKPRGRLWIFAHNLPFDATISKLWQFCSNGMLTLDNYVIDDPPTIIQLKHGKRRIICVDSMNYWPAKLEEIGDKMGIPKFDRPMMNDDDDVWYRYCCQDVHILREFILSYMFNVWYCDLGNFSPTIAGQAMQAFKHRFMANTLDLQAHNKVEVLQREREAYHGGRIVCNYIGEINSRVYHLDVNNLYPFVMKDGFYPEKLAGIVYSPTIEYAKDLSTEFVALAQVDIEATKFEYPFKTADGWKYCRGKFITHLCGAELIRALFTGEAKHIYFMSIYSPFRIFNEWCEYWFKQLRELKKGTDKLAAAMIKQMVNALSGKFAQKSTRWTKQKDCDLPIEYGTLAHYDESDETCKVYRAVAGVVQLREDATEAMDSMPIISACITSEARVYMDMLRAVAGKGNVYYQDTDSLFTNEDGLQNLLRDGYIEQSTPGFLKIVSQHERTVFYGPKRYEVDGKLIAAGISRNASCIADGIFVQDTWQGARRQLSDNPAGIVRVRDRRVSLSQSGKDSGAIVMGWREPPTIGL